MKFFIEIFYWCLIALCPILIITIINMLIYNYICISFTLLVIVEIIGVILGIILAEYIRRKYGCSVFYSKLMNTPDLEDN